MKVRTGNENCNVRKEEESPGTSASFCHFVGLLLECFARPLSHLWSLLHSVQDILCLMLSFLILFVWAHDLSFSTGPCGEGRGKQASGK